MQIKPNEGAPQPRLPSIRPQAAGTLAETGDVKQALGSALETRPEAVSVSLSGAVRALATALSQVLPDLGPPQVAELLTQADRLMLVRARDFAQAAHIELDEVKKLVVDLYLFRALEQGGEMPFVPLLQAAVAAFAPRASLDAALAEPSVPGHLVLPVAGEPDAAGELGNAAETQAAPLPVTPSPAARPSGGNPAMSSGQSALGAAPALALPTFTPRDEALARAILGGTALRDTPLDRRFVQALLDPDQQPSHAVDFAFLRRLVVALSALPDRAAPDPLVSFARRDARAQLAQAVSALALSLRELPQVGSAGFDRGATILLARLPSLLSETPLPAGFAPNASSAAESAAPALAPGVTNGSPVAQAPTALPERVPAPNAASPPQAAAPWPASAQPSAPVPTAPPPAASLPAQVTAQPSAARAAAMATRSAPQTPDTASPLLEAASQGGTGLAAGPTPAGAAPGEATTLTTRAATPAPQQDSSTSSTQAAAWGEAPAPMAPPAQTAAPVAPAAGRDVAALPASAPSATPAFPAPPLGTPLGPSAAQPTTWDGTPQVSFAAQGALAAPLGTSPPAYGTSALPPNAPAPQTTPHRTGAVQRPAAGAATPLTPPLANTVATLRNAYVPAPAARTGSAAAHAAPYPRSPAAPTREAAPLTHSDRALLSLLYAATEQRGEGPQEVDDVARALISLRRAERAEAPPRSTAASPSEAPPTTRAAEAAPTRAALAQPARDQPARRARELAEPTPPPTNDVRSAAPEAVRSWLRAGFEPPLPTGAREHTPMPQASDSPRETPRTAAAPASTTTAEGSLSGSARSFGSSTQLAARVAGSYGSFAPPSMAQAGASLGAGYGATPTFDALAGREAAPHAAPAWAPQPLPQRPLDVAQALGVKGLVGALRERSLRSLRLAQRPGRDAGVRGIEGLREAAYDAEVDDPLLEASARRRRRARWQLLLQRRKRRRKQER